MQHKVVLNTGSYFEWHFKLVGACFMLVGSVWIFENFFGGALLLIGATATFATNYYVLIDLDSKIYREGVSVFGLKTGERKNFDKVEYLFVKGNKVSRSYNSRIQSSTITDIEFDGYIRFSELEKVHLFQAKEKQKVVDRLVPLSNQLRVEIVDYTGQVRETI